MLYQLVEARCSSLLQLLLRYAQGTPLGERTKWCPSQNKLLQITKAEEQNSNGAVCFGIFFIVM